MEYVKGEPITAYCDRHRLGTAERLELFVLVCEGVHHAHQKGIIHRDLKPSNVLVTLQDAKPVPKIIDFGVAKATTQHLTARTLFTELGVLIGTPEYMSPEQADLTALDIDTRTDVYALGALLYELLTGALPFDRKMLREKCLDEIRRTIREVEPPRPSTRITQLGPASTEAAKNRQTEPSRLAHQLRGDLDWITMKALEKNRSRRYGTVVDLASDVRRHLRNEPVTAGPPSARYRTTKFIQRHRFGVAAATTVVLLIVALGTVMAVQARRIARERDRANREAAAAQQVADFLVGLFRVSDPREAQGKSITTREVLDRAATRIDSEPARDPILRARLLMTMGDVYRNLGALDRAEDLLTQSAALRRERLGPHAPDTLRALSVLGAVLDLRGRFAEAQRLLETVLPAEQRVLGRDHPDTLKTLANLANLYDSQGRYEPSGQLMQEVLERRRTVLGPDHLETLGSQYNFAVAMYRAGRLAEAERLLGAAAVALERVAGVDHPQTIATKDLLGIVYLNRDMLPQARRVFEEVHERRRRVLGPDHMDTLSSQLSLANVARKEGKFPEAEPLYRATLAAQERILGSDHGDAIATLVSLASLLVAVGRDDEAERAFRNGLARIERVQGPNHPDAANCLVGLAEVEVHRGRHDVALRLLADAVRVDPRWASRFAASRALEPLTTEPGFQELLTDGQHR